MKRLIIGDIHGHWDAFKSIYDLENADEVIILGDYFDNFHGSDESIKECFLDLSYLQKQHNAEKSGKFIMLIGNHDYHYMHWYEKYSGYRSSYAPWAKIQLTELENEKLIQYVYIDNTNKIIYSHAGVSNSWLKENAKFDICDKNLEYINKMNPTAFKFTYKGGGDCYGNSFYSSPIWIRPEALKLDLYKGDDEVVWTQIVGHTHYNNPQLYKGKHQICNTQEDIDKNNPNLYILDCMPNAYLVQMIDDKTNIIEQNIIKKFSF